MAHMRWAHVNACRVYLVSNMLLVLSIAFHFHYNIWGSMCSTVPFQFRWLKGYLYSSCYYHHQIGSIDLTHCFHIFPRLCAWDVCYIIHWNENVFILMKSSSLAAPKVVKMTTFGAASDETFIKMMTFSFQCMLLLIAYTFRENRDFLFISIVLFMISSNSRMRFDLQIVFVCLYITPSHYHHCANLSEDIELIKCLSDIFCRVCE